MANFNQQLIYNCGHTIDALPQNGTSRQRNVTIKIQRREQIIQIKVCDPIDYSFNYTANVDRSIFEQMRVDQSLDIGYEEFSLQIVDLLKHTLSNEMLVRLEYNDNFCKLIFYEKMRIKSLIFLTIDLLVTNQREIIEEMSALVKQLKDSNKNLTLQVSSAENDLREKDAYLRSTQSSNSLMKTQFRRDLQSIEKAFVINVTKIESVIADKLLVLGQRHFKLSRDLAVIKHENGLKCESSLRLVNSLQTLRLENERQLKTINDMRMEINAVKLVKNNVERNNSEHSQHIERLQNENGELNKKIIELRGDLQEATFIIAQKTKTHEEMAKDLVQANSMLVNFTNHYDSVSKELASAKNMISKKDQDICDGMARFNELKANYEKYRCEYSTEEFNAIKQELAITKHQCEELEKKNREAIKLNALLTRKLSSGDQVMENTNHATTSTKPFSPWKPRNNNI